VGQALVDLKLATEADIVRALSVKFGFGIAALDTLEPYAHAQALALLPRDFALRNNVFPMAADTTSVTVAMSDPTNLAVVDEVSFRTGRRVKVCIGGDREVAEALRRHYPGEDVVEAIALDIDLDDREVDAIFDPFGGGSKDALEAFYSPTALETPAVPAAAAPRRDATVEQRAPAPAARPAPSAPAAHAAPAAKPSSATLPAATAPAPGARAAAAPPRQAAVAAAPRAAAPAPPQAAQGAPAAQRPQRQAPVPASPAPALAVPPVAAGRLAAPAAPTAAAPPRAAPAELELEPVPADPAAPALARHDGDAGGEQILATDGVPGPGSPEAAPAAVRFTPREANILAALERLASGAHAEPEILKPTQAMAAIARLLLRKGLVTERELLDELVRK
jgi:hypothetical protein